MNKALIVICMFLASLPGVFRITPLLAEQFDYQNYNHGYYPTCERCHRNPCQCQNRPGMGAINAPPRPPGSCPEGYCGSAGDGTPCDGASPCYYPAQPSCGIPAYTSPINTAAPCGQQCEEPADPPASNTEKTCDPCQPPGQAPCGQAPCAEAPCEKPCDPAPVCGTDCGISICALGIGLAALAAAAAIIVSSGNGKSHH